MIPGDSGVRAPSELSQQVMTAQAQAQPQMNGTSSVPRTDDPAVGLDVRSDFLSRVEPSTSATVDARPSGETSGVVQSRGDVNAAPSFVEEVRSSREQAGQQAAMTIPDVGQDLAREPGGATLSSVSYGSFRTPRSTASPPPMPWPAGLKSLDG